MRPVYIVVEGQTEQDFFRECLCPYWQTTYGLYDVHVRLLGKVGEKGGNVSASRIQHDADALLKQRPTAIVSTFVDYYGIRTSLPNYVYCQSLPTADQRIRCLELALGELINSERFIPYVQKHEFEALLFTKPTNTNSYISGKLSDAIRQTATEFSTPEDIDSDSPPSKRFERLFIEYEQLRYDKRVFGVALALELGIKPILDACPRFANWVNQIAQAALRP